MKLKGRPKKVDFDDWLNGSEQLQIVKDGERSAFLEFKVATSADKSRKAFEMLYGVAANNPHKIMFRFLMDGDSTSLVFSASQPGPVYDLGKVPRPIHTFISKAHNWRLFEEFAEVVDYAIGLSLVGREVDRQRVMGMADFGELDDLSQKQFDDLIDSLRETMSQETYVIKVRLRLSPDPKTGELPAWQDEGDKGEVINV